jgi:presenilin-like A22 family membrane protease
MGVMISAIVIIPNMILVVLFLTAYSLLTFIFTYFISSKWYVAVLPPIVFIFMYFFFWNIYTIDFFAFTFAVLITIYLGNLFTWRVTLIFAGLLTAMDIIHVLFTGAMIQAAGELVNLQLPVAIEVPKVPFLLMGNRTISLLLGLGDLFFVGLLAVKTSRKFGSKLGVISAVAMSASFFAFETLFLTYGDMLRAFPGTLMIICGWLLVVFVKKLRERTSKT